MRGPDEELSPKSGPHVVVIGGWGGATAAKYVRLYDPKIEVVLTEPNRQFISSPFSNPVLAGVRSIGPLLREASARSTRAIMVAPMSHRPGGTVGSSA